MKIPLEGYKESVVFKWKVLGITPTTCEKTHITFSLRILRGGYGFVDERDTNKIQIGFHGCLVEKVHDLIPSMEVKGYVKNIFENFWWLVMLSNHIEAKILPCNLFDTYIENSS